MQPIRDSRIAYVTVEHENYGCETGCCGWVAYAYDATGAILHQSPFEFMHGWAASEPEGERKAAIEFAEGCFPDAEFNESESDYHCPEG